MNPFRVLLMTAAFLASAVVAQAQSVSVASMQAIEDALMQLPRPLYLQHPPQYFPPSPAYPLPRELASLEAASQAACDHDCCDANWYARALKQGVTAWQRVRSMCVMDCQTCCQPACAALGQVKPGVCRDAHGVVGSAKGLHGHAGCPAVNSNHGIAGSAMIVELVAKQTACCGLKDFTQLKCPLGYTMAQASAPCCCAKACACCEMCKMKAAATERVQVVPVAPAPSAPPVAWTLPQPMPAPPIGARVVMSTPASIAPAAPTAQLVTPDFEAHCQRITHRDGHVILEGNVMLLCRKNTQPMRIHAGRIVVNLRDGSFTVDSIFNPTPVLRTSVEMPPPLMMPTPITTYQRVIEVPVIPATTPR